jgi:deoxyribonuclease-1
MLLVVVMIIVMIGGPAAAQEPPRTFAAAKQLLADIHEEIGHLRTLYCGCPYVRTTSSGGDIDRETCGLQARKNEARSDRVEWEHVVPASWFGSIRACWQLKADAYPECRRSNGKSLSGRKCCEKVNAEFMRANVDPNNLFPSGGEVNGDRSNFPYGEINEEPRAYGACDFEFDGDVAEPGEKVRGELARAMLHMSTTYGVDVRVPIRDLVEWSAADPPAPWEIRRAEIIAERTGMRNAWILGPTR